MAEKSSYPVLSVCATIASKLPDLAIKNGQLIFVQDKHKIVFDYNDKRVFYNQIEELATESDRQAILAPVTGRYYFVISTAVLWTYQDGWVQLTTPPEEIIFIGTEMPELGSAKTLYVNKTKKEISVWDNEASSYMVIANRTEEISNEEIDSFFV